MDVVMIGITGGVAACADISYTYVSLDNNDPDASLRSAMWYGKQNSAMLS